MKKTVWYEVQENETITQCIERMNQDGYAVMGRKEEPIFIEENGQKVPLRQLIKLKGVLKDEQ